MQLSWSLAKETFFKERNFIFTDKKFTGQLYRKNLPTAVVGLVGMLVFIHEFVMLTPDVQFDIRRLTSIDFDRFVMKKGHGYYDPYHENYITNYYSDVEKNKYYDSTEGIIGSNLFGEFSMK